ncbi:MAG: tetratricopeptide repeat protein, partial [Gammaproteobacteria bacterium]|nr:tetratricopeptide repeat protein [Gammaproteobacteria bacterium]
IDQATKHVKEHLKLNPHHISSLKLIAYIEFQTKNFADSLEHLSTIISINKADAETYNLMGCIYLETGAYTQCSPFFLKSIECDATYIDAYTNLAFTYQKLNQSTHAIEVCKAALQIDPGSINALRQLATISLSTGDFQNSLNSYLDWKSIEPDSSQMNMGLARCYLGLKEVNKVVDLLNELKACPDKSPFIRLDMSNLLLEHGQTKAAITSYLSLIEDVKERETVYNNIASAYDRQNDSEKAIEYFLKAIEINSNYTPAYSNIGRIYTDIKQFENAENSLLKALEIEPNNVNALINMGRLHDVKNDFAKAKIYFEQAVKLAPDNPMAHSNLGNAYHQLGNFKLSSQHYEACLSIDPYYADAEQNLGINELAMGKFDTAWGHYFQRVRVLDHGEKLSPITPGMSLSGKHIYFCRSQGVGDELFFLRFLPELKKQNVTITYRSSQKTFSLFSQIADIDHIINENDPTPECDYYFTIDDLPLILNINDINKIAPSLKLKPDLGRVNKIKQILLKYPPPYNGITWRAGKQEIQTSHRDNLRILSKIIPMSCVEKVTMPLKGTIVILQRNPDKSELEELKRFVKQPVLDLSQYNDSLDDMLALLSQIDSYIGVSNTNMHLFSALGKTADVFVPFPPEWRWMTEGSSSPWFPGFGIYRQLVDGDWQRSVDELIKKLAS